MIQLRTTPLTAVLVVASAAWVKGPLFVAAAALRDFKLRRMLPLYALVTAAAFGLTSLVTDILKGVFERPRPPFGEDSIAAIGEIPTSASFPSGHASTAFAAAVAVSVLVPRWRWPALGLAALVGFSRIYLGVHYTLDVLAGALLGAAIGFLDTREQAEAAGIEIKMWDPATQLRYQKKKAVPERPDGAANRWPDEKPEEPVQLSGMPFGH